MAEEKNKELSPDEDLDKVLGGESPEEEEKKPEEPSEEEVQEYTKERFDGLMSAWQSDRQKMLEIEKELSDLRKSQQPQTPAATAEEQYINYLGQKLDDRRKKVENEEDEMVEMELKQVANINPDLDPDEILETAIKYSPTRGEAIPLDVAAGILRDIKTGQGIKTSLKETEEERKRRVGALAGRPGAGEKIGIKPYEPEKEGRKSYEQLIEEGKKELGI